MSDPRRSFFQWYVTGVSVTVTLVCILAAVFLTLIVVWDTIDLLRRHQFGQVALLWLGSVVSYALIFLLFVVAGAGRRLGGSG